MPRQTTRWNVYLKEPGVMRLIASYVDERMARVAAIIAERTLRCVDRDDIKVIFQLVEGGGEDE